MKFKVDENLPIEVADLLKNNGHDATTVHDEQLIGRPDEDIAAVCISEARTLITLDIDFANLLSYPPELYRGIIVIRTKDQSKSSVLQILRKIIVALEDTPIDQLLWIVEENRIRIRSNRGD